MALSLCRVLHYKANLCSMFISLRIVPGTSDRQCSVLPLKKLICIKLSLGIALMGISCMLFKNLSGKIVIHLEPKSCQFEVDDTGCFIDDVSLSFLSC